MAHMQPSLPWQVQHKCADRSVSSSRRSAMNNKISGAWLRSAMAATLLALSATALGGDLKSLTVCADPGNMLLSNEKGEGFENKIAQVIGAALVTGVQYYWRPSIERGLMRTTLSEGNCDLWMD